MTTTTTGGPSAFSFPREYHFPAFFTKQPNLTTRHAQLTKWAALTLSYARHARLFKLSLSSAPESELFHNKSIDRRLSAADVREVVDFMRKDGRAEFVGGGGGAAGDVVFLYWRKPEEWAAAVEAFVEETGQKGSVLTVYELAEGEGTRGTGEWFSAELGEGGRARLQPVLSLLLLLPLGCGCVVLTSVVELHGMDQEVLLKALNILVKRGKAQIFGQDDSLGVKFF